MLGCRSCASDSDATTPAQPTHRSHDGWARGSERDPERNTGMGRAAFVRPAQTWGDRPRGDTLGPCPATRSNARSIRRRRPPRGICAHRATLHKRCRCGARAARPLKEDRCASPSRRWPVDSATPRDRTSCPTVGWSWSRPTPARSWPGRASAACMTTQPAVADPMPACWVPTGPSTSPRTAARWAPGRRPS